MSRAYPLLLCAALAAALLLVVWSPPRESSRSAPDADASSDAGAESVLGGAGNRVAPALDLAGDFAAALARDDHEGAAALLELWLQADEAAALAAVAELPFERVRFGTALFTELSAHFDRQPARSALATILDALAESPELRRQLAADRYREFSRVELDGAIEWLGATAARIGPLARDLAGELGIHQRSNGAIDRLALHERLPTPELRAACLLGMTESWIEVRPLEATEALLRLPRAPEVEDVLAFAVVRVARTQPELAMALADTLADETRRERARAEVAEIWAIDAPDAYLAWREAERQRGR
jgi:hypothetical protein